jgi:hypothetical protein
MTQKNPKILKCSSYEEGPHFLCLQKGKQYFCMAAEEAGWNIKCKCFGGYRCKKIIEIQAKDLALYTHWACHSTLYWELLV